MGAGRGAPAIVAARRASVTRRAVHLTAGVVVGVPPFRRVRYDGTTGKFASRPLSDSQTAVNQAHSAIRGPGERANADLKNWRILRKIRSSPSHATTLVNRSAS